MFGHVNPEKVCRPQSGPPPCEFARMRLSRRRARPRAFESSDALKPDVSAWRWDPRLLACEIPNGPETRNDCDASRVLRVVEH